jgi:hypothetical protein
MGGEDTRQSYNDVVPKPGLECRGRLFPPSGHTDLVAVTSGLDVVVGEEGLLLRHGRRL